MLDDLHELEADKKQDLAQLMSSLRKHRSVLVGAGQQTVGCGRQQVKEELASQFEKRLELPPLTGAER